MAIAIDPFQVVIHIYLCVFSCEKTRGMMGIFHGFAVRLVFFLGVKSPKDDLTFREIRKSEWHPKRPVDRNPGINITSLSEVWYVEIESMEVTTLVKISILAGCVWDF